jgi:hypothetical protein
MAIRPVPTVKVIGRSIAAVASGMFIAASRERAISVAGRRACPHWRSARANQPRVCRRLPWPPL